MATNVDSKIADTNVGDQPLDEYECFVIEDVRVKGEALTLVYGEHVFGGILRCLLDSDGMEDALRPGTEIFVRLSLPFTPYSLPTKDL